MIAYKGFNPGLICRGYQFAMGINRTMEANCRANGFHCAANPLDCLSHYPDIQKSEYYIVDAGGDIDEDGSDSKISCTELTIIKRLEIRDFFMLGLAFMADHPQLTKSRCVRQNQDRAYQGYAVICGTNPLASGEIGDILALAKEDSVQRRIAQIACVQVDGKEILPNVWYDIDLKKCGEYL